MTHSHGPLRVGVGGPVGSGKTALMDALCKRLRDRYEIAAITNDIYTKWDAEYLVRSGALEPDRIAGVETGGCPHTAIREDASANLAAIADMRQKFPGARSGADRIRRRQSRRDVLAGACRSDDLRHRRRRRRQDPVEGRPGHHPLRPSGDQQGRPRAPCRRVAGERWSASPSACAARGRSFSPICAPARASTRSRISSRRRAGWAFVTRHGRACPGHLAASRLPGCPSRARHDDVAPTPARYTSAPLRGGRNSAPARTSGSGSLP